MTMRFYSHSHSFYCGIDLHARTMHLCILDQAGNIVLDKNIAARPETFLKAIAPCRDQVVVGVECMYAWYWLADLCATEKIAFVLGHALYMKLIYGAKAKNDQIDAGKIARLLRGGTFPLAYAYPKGMRETRDLLRRRNYLVHKRAELIAHIQITNAQYNLPPFGKKLIYAKNRAELKVAERFPDEQVRKSITIDVAVVDFLDEQIADVELYLKRTVKVEDPHSYFLLQTIPGVGPILGLVLLYEIHQIARFADVTDFLSYARLVRCVHRSGGKQVGTGGKKIGNAHLKWAFSEVVCLLIRSCPTVKAWQARQGKKRRVPRPRSPPRL
jgi:transposase